jgi:hypothetical protein
LSQGRIRLGLALLERDIMVKLSQLRPTEKRALMQLGIFN